MLVRDKEKANYPGFGDGFTCGIAHFYVYLALTCVPAICLRKIHVEKDSRSNHGVILEGSYILELTSQPSQVVLRR